MTRREAIGRLVDAARLSLLRLRVRIARPLPVTLMAALRALDRPWTPAASDRLDKFLVEKDREQ